MSDDSIPELPLVADLPASMTAADVFKRLRRKSHCVFFDSSLRHESLGRYSFVACDPFKIVNHRDGDLGSRNLIEALVGHEWHSSLRTELPPFQGGWAGVLNYEFGRVFETLPTPKTDEFSLGVGCFAAYDVVVAFDNAIDRGWIISQGFPASDSRERLQRANERLQLMLSWIGKVEQESPLPASGSLTTIRTPMHEIAGHEMVFSNFDRAEYLAAVERVIEYIRAGDIFQANLSQRLLAKASRHASELYLRLRQRAPATFSGYFDAGEWQVVSASPERFVNVRDKLIESRPIKGTRRQTQQPIADLFAAADLHDSHKDNAENVMIVDLIRNDLSRVCEDDSLHVTQLCGLETYGYVQHLVSAVNGELRENQSLIDVLCATFPGGSITGAPKIRAMEIICELEQVARGPYCGSMGYVNWNGDVDFNILIRTITAAGGWWQMPVGGGIVVDSNSSAEYEETWHKAAGLLAAVK